MGQEQEHDRSGDGGETGSPRVSTGAAPAGSGPVGDPGGTAEDWLARFAEGDEAAFHRIVGEYQARLVQFYYRLCWDRDAAEDFAQDLFMKLLRGARRYRPEGKLSTFIFRVATNLWIDHYRSARPQPRLYSLDQPMLGSGRSMAARVPAGGAGPQEVAIDGEQRAQLRAALESLTEPHRLVFELAVYQELPYAEIGQILGIPLGTVKSRMHNSVKALKAVLDPERQEVDRPSPGSFRAAGGSG